METKRNRRQFSTRALLLASAFIALIFGLIVRIESANAREQKLISQLRSMDVGQFGSIEVWPKGLPMCGMGMTGLGQTETIPAFLEEPCEYIGYNPFERVTDVWLVGDACTDKVIDLVANFNHIREITFDLRDISPECLNRFRLRHPSCKIIDNGESESPSNNPMDRSE